MVATPPGADRQQTGPPHAQGPRRLRALDPPAERPEHRLADLVLVDQHEAQGWRARQDERLDTLFEQRCDWNRQYGRADRLALAAPTSGAGRESLTYDELDAGANRLAHYLRLHGASAGDRIALLFDRTVHAYSAMLAVLKIGGAYVPLDAGAPAETTAAIIAGARVSAVLTRAAVRERLGADVRSGELVLGADARSGTQVFGADGRPGTQVFGAPGRSRAELIVVDEAAPLVGELSPRRLLPAERGAGTTGPAAVLPTGRAGAIAVDHRGLCNAVRVVVEVHGIREDDRIYHGDALGAGPAEPIWLAWAAGATLVPAPAPLHGRELQDFLAEHRITVLTCTPGLLATLDPDLPDLRVVLLSGEPCPQPLVARWRRPGRRLVNTYRSRATGTVTHAELRPGLPVTIGVPLPTFSTVILAADGADAALPHGETGEIGVAGIGLAARPLDRAAADGVFVDDFLGIPGNPSGLIYRTGDLGRVTGDGEIEYLGRIGEPVPEIEPAPQLPAALAAAQAPAQTAAAQTAATQPAADRVATVDETPAGRPATATPTTTDRPGTAEQTAVIEAVGHDTSAERELAIARAELARLRAAIAGMLEQFPGQATAPVADEPATTAFPNVRPDVLPAAGEPATTIFPAVRPDAVPAQGEPTTVFPAVPGRPELPAADSTTAFPAAPRPAAPRPSAPSPAVGEPTAVLPAVPGRPELPAADATVLPAVPARRRPRPSPAGAEPTTVFPAVARKADPRPAPARRPGAVPAVAEPVRRLPAVSRPAASPAARPAATPAAQPAAQPAAAPAVATAFAEVLAGVLGVERVPVEADVFDDLGADSLVMTRFCAQLRKRADLPDVSIKDVYAHPTLATLAAFAAPTAAPARQGSGAVAAGLAEVLSGVLGVERVPVEADVFDDLGADSLVMTRFCAQLRKRADLPDVSIKDVYAHPTIAALAAFAAPAAEPAARPGAAGPDPAAMTARIPVLPRPASTVQYLFCGAVQLLIFLAYSYGASTVLEFGYQWIAAETTLPGVYQRAVEFGAGAFAIMCTLPILVKWLLVGRWKPRRIRVWSLGYVRFWIVKTLIRSNPLALLAVGTPLYSLYLRALGAKIGRNVVIYTKHVPVCTDLISIGDNTVIRNESYLSGYRAQAGMIEIGPVGLGADVFVGEKTVLDIGTSIGDGAQLGHTSSLHSGQAVPAGARWHGSPAEPTTVNYRTVEPARVGTLRRAAYVAGQLAKLLGIYLPLAFGGIPLLLAEVPQLRTLLEVGPPTFASLSFYLDAVLISAVLTVGGLLLGLLVTFTVPRLLNLFLTPDKVYPLYGFHFGIQRTITRLTNIKLFTYLFGDSSYIVGYLRGLGYDLGKVEQTGSNFGSAVTHETPYLSRVGTGTVVADGLHFINADYSGTSFKVSRVSIGARNFLGNHIAYPAGGRTGDNCLLATKVQVPIEGPVREGVGLLGSPSFEIPRSVQRDLGLEVSPDEQRRRLRAKNRHNLLTLVFALLVRWGHLLGVTVLSMLALDVFLEFGPLAVGAQIVASLLFTFSYFVLVERMGAGFRRLRPKSCSIYDRAFWRHERYWKLVLPEIEKALAGTPFINIVTRALGVRLGRRVYDEGASKTERTLTAIGDDCMLNEGSILQCHSQEDGAFKSDRSSLGAGVTIGVGALVHYGVTVGDGAILAPDSFLMKGEEVPPYTVWGGNPARELESIPAARPAPAFAGTRPAHQPSIDNRGAVLAAATA